jgi:hypothetical protein
VVKAESGQYRGGFWNLRKRFVFRGKGFAKNKVAEDYTPCRVISWRHQSFRPGFILFPGGSDGEIRPIR